MVETIKNHQKKQIQGSGFKAGRISNKSCQENKSDKWQEKRLMENFKPLQVLWLVNLPLPPTYPPPPEIGPFLWAY